MAAFVLTNAYFSINAVDLSDHVTSITLDYGADAPEKTAMGDTTHLMMGGGLKNWSASVEFNQDFAASEVDVSLFSIVGTAVAIVIKPVNDTTSATNPKFTGTAVVTAYNPIGGAVGDKASASITLAAGSTLARETSDA